MGNRDFPKFPFLYISHDKFIRDYSFDNMMILKEFKKIKNLTSFLADIATILILIMTVFIYFKITIPYHHDILLVPTIGEEKGEILLHIHNRGDFIHNGTIYALLLEKGVYKTDEKQEYVGSLPKGTSKTYPIRFNPIHIKSNVNYTVYIRVEADDGRVVENKLVGIRFK